MAEKMTAENAGTGHNSNEIEALIAKTADEIYRIKRETEALVEKHIRPLKNREKELKHALKRASDIALRDFTLRYKLYERERLAREVYEDDGPGILDSQRVLEKAFRKAPMGGQVNFLDALEEENAEESGAENEDLYARYLRNVEALEHDTDVVIMQHRGDWVSFSIAAQHFAEAADKKLGAYEEPSGSKVAYIAIPAMQVKKTVAAVRTSLNVVMVSEDDEHTRLEKHHDVDAADDTAEAAE